MTITPAIMRLDPDTSVACLCEDWLTDPVPFGPGMMVRYGTPGREFWKTWKGAVTHGRDARAQLTSKGVSLSRNPYSGKWQVKVVATGSRYLGLSWPLTDDQYRPAPPAAVDDGMIGDTTRAIVGTVSPPLDEFPEPDRLGDDDWRAEMYTMCNEG